MYIRMSQNCDKVVVLKSVSNSVMAYDSEGNQLKGLRKNTTIQVASFDLIEPIYHPEISDDEASKFEEWRRVQISRINKVFVENAAAGKYGGTPLLKTRIDCGDPLAKVGEFSGVIVPLVELSKDLIQSVVNAQRADEHPNGSMSRTLDDDVTSESVCSDILEIVRRIIRFINLNGRKGSEIYSQEQTLDMRAAWASLGCALDGRGVGYKVEGTIDGRNAAKEGQRLFNEIKKSVFE
jgi:hypothetical protein